MNRLWRHSIRGVGLSRFLQFRFNTMLVRLLPMRMGRAYIGLMGRVYYSFNREEKDEIKRNLTTVIRRMPIRESLDLTARRTFRGVFDHYYEKIFLAYTPLREVCGFLRQCMKLEHLHVLDEALSQGRGLMLVTAHFGAVEFLPLTLALQGYAVTMVVRFKTERLKRTLNKRCEHVPITLLDANEGDGVVFSALRALKSNQILITECDEFEAWRPYRNRQTEFLGYSSPLDRTLDLFHRRYNSPSIMGIVQREQGNDLGLKLHPLNGPYHFPQGKSITERALRILEEYIYLRPDQWFQWEQLRIILGTEIIEETRTIYATEANRSLPVADSAVRTF